MVNAAGAVAIVTGASSGIGAATAIALARKGAWVLLVARRAGELSKTLAAITSAGGHGAALAADITSAPDRDRIIEAALARNGRIDVLVNCAGIGQRGAVETVPLERVRECFDVNVFAPIALIQRVAPVMRAQGSGRIVNVSSMSGRIPRPFSAIYDASKHAVEAISDGLREELAPFGVHVIVVQPGYTKSGFSAAADPRDPEPAVYDPFMSTLKRRDWRRRYAVTPERVAGVIVQAVEAAAPRTRYAVPRVVTLALLLRRLCPDRMFYRLMLGPAPRRAEGR